MNTLIVSPCVALPVPAVHGGAISTLIEYLVKENEIKKKMHLTVLSIFDAEAQKKAEEYTYTKFEYINPARILDQWDQVADTVLSFVKKNRKNYQIFRKQHSLRCISRYMREHDFDKVVFQNSGYLLNVLNDHFLAKKYEGKLYYHLHNDIPDNISIKAVRQCRLILISEYLKRHINEVCGQDMSSQCVIVKNGFDCTRFAQKLPEVEKTALRKRLGIAQEKKIVMFAGRIAATKGIAELTQAIEKLNREDVVLMVVGAHNFGTGQTSAFQKEMEQRFAALREKVCFTGYVPYDEIWRYYQIADVAALPSVWDEPAGLTMIEASAAGVPLITTRSGGIPEYLDSEFVNYIDRGSDIVSHLRNAIIWTLDHRVEASDKASKASDYVIKNYSESRFYNDFWKAIT